MHHKNMRLIIRKQLKRQYPNWNRLNKKRKKEIARKILAEVTAEYDFNQDIQASGEELLGIEQQIPTEGIIKLDEMARFIDMVNSSKVIKFNSYNRSPIYFKDQELRFIDELLDDGIINRLLAYDGYSPAMREIFPSNLFRAELLKAIKYPEISYRKFTCKIFRPSL